PAPPGTQRPKSVPTPPETVDTTVASAEPTSAATTEPPTTSTPPTSTTAAPTSTSTTVEPTPTIHGRRLNAAALDAFISSATVDLGDVSAGAAVIRNGEVLHAAGFGMENPLTPATSLTTFRLRSGSSVLYT